eukprot:s13138_g1.t2
MDLSVLPSLLRFASFQSELDDLKASLLEKDANPVPRMRQCPNAGCAEVRFVTFGFFDSFQHRCSYLRRPP